MSHIIRKWVISKKGASVAPDQPTQSSKEIPGPFMRLQNLGGLYRVAPDQTVHGGLEQHLLDMVLDLFSYNTALI
ncbi:hypothetical protein DPMN_060508 [Dreissena polymorpha]|uniref:Uncharacterized protein n=1 Tax=Dreissena polymorpha TaxID=45954 RepID=A0A9D4C5C7_DREPO|nr:hypothetical protein DPMN_060508 [Dreissena polymorpha]